MADRLHYFGIRHHGPGSAASLLAALDAVDPALVLIEGPPEADALIAHAGAEGMRPPVALLAYVTDDAARASFFPFADYSPEWQAIRWALARGRPVRFIDWPVAMALAIDREDDARDRDPMDELAELAGHSDGEAWWNALVESQQNAPAVFAAIEAAMTALRDEEEAAIPSRETYREAHMRLAVRAALKEEAGRIAVITGAWHTPALRRPVPAADDRQTLRDLPRVKVQMTWVPWSDSRLATRSGYRAGVLSPGWYAHLWASFIGGGSGATDLAAGWQARVAAMLRAEGQVTATASVIDATRLALSLAGLRGRPVPGLAEMTDGSLAALCHGEPAVYRLVERRLLIGEGIGEIGEGVPQPPLQADLARWQRRLRLKPEAEERKLSLDLRSDNGLAVSTLLHRLVLIDVRWGELTDAQSGRGTFREIWRLVWQPELSVKLAEAIVWGTTIEKAAAGAAVARAEAAETVGPLAELVRSCLFADLPQAAETCIARLQAAAVHATDIAALAAAVPPLVNVLRYGTARAIPTEALTSLVGALVVEVTAGIRLGSRNLDADATAQMRTAINAFDQAMVLFDQPHLAAEWRRALLALADDPASVPLLAGLALRRLYDAQVLTAEAAGTRLGLALSPAVPALSAGAWIDGFLDGAAEVLLQDATLLGLIDAWLAGTDAESFLELLPMLRRGFSAFGAVARKRLLERIGRVEAASAPAAPVSISSIDPAFEAALPLLFTILGLGDDKRPDR